MISSEDSFELGVHIKEDVILRINSAIIPQLCTLLIDFFDF
jgi:hypothetical protein